MVPPNQSTLNGSEGTAQKKGSRCLKDTNRIFGPKTRLKKLSSAKFFKAKAFPQGGPTKKLNQLHETRLKLEAHLNNKLKSTETKEISQLD